MKLKINFGGCPKSCINHFNKFTRCECECIPVNTRIINSLYINHSSVCDTD